MFEWQTATAEVTFAEDFPWDAVTREFGNMQEGEVRVADPATWPFRLLNYPRDSANW